MSKKTPFNRIDAIKDVTAKKELARAHAMVALLGLSSGVLLWTLYFSENVTLSLVILATILLACVILFSAGIAYALSRPRD